MKINHEETDSHRSSLFFLRFLRFFVVDFLRSHSRVRKTRPETMKICGTRWHLVPRFRRRKDEHIMAGPEVGLTRVAKAARLYLDRRPDAGDWHRGDDRDVQRSQRCVAPALALWGRNARCCPMANQFEKRRRARGDFARQFF